MAVAKRIATHSLLALFFVGFFFALLPVAEAQGLVPQTCRENVRNCDFCALFQMGVNLINLLFQLMVIAAVILIVVAGLRLATSAGNVSAMESAKSMLSHVLIGFIIVLSAWLIVDTIMRILVKTEDGFGVWNELNIDCGHSVGGDGSGRDDTGG